MTSKNTSLPWPQESSSESSDAFNWHHPSTNYCLDFHGNPTNAKLTVFSDGNHHMALEACCQKFLSLHPEVNDIFYATTPPGVLVNAIQSGALQLGNLNITAKPDIFISPENIMSQLKQQAYIDEYTPLAESLGNVMLVRKSNPKNIQSFEDLLRDDVRLFISNPVTEKASHDVYHNTILGLATEQNLNIDAYKQKINSATFGERIHHRECPQSLFNNDTDVAVIYYHLALRYCRIFPDHFEMVHFNGSTSTNEPESTAANETTIYYIGVVNNEGWGEAFKTFMLSSDATDLYKQHGLGSA